MKGKLSLKEFENLPKNSRELVIEIIKENPGISQEEIRKKASKRFNRRLSQGFAYQWCKKLSEEGIIDVKKIGNKNAYYIKETTPAIKIEVWYRVEPNKEGDFVVTSFTISNKTITLNNLPLQKLQEFHKNQMQYREYFKTSSSIME